MNNILQTIFLSKKAEVEYRKSVYPVKLLQQSIYFDAPTVSLKEHLLHPAKIGIIAEFKRRSPAKGVINPYAAVERTSVGYRHAGASALSVLTDETFFGGKNEDLTLARQFNYCPVLRKDFVVDEYQIMEARAIGADAVLLIAAMHTAEKIKALSLFARSLNLEVVLEIHEKEELNHIHPTIDVIGINNRNLKTFKTDIRHSLSLLSALPQGFVRISESGINSPDTAASLLNAGFDGLLIGEHFMQNNRPGKACADFILQLKTQLYEN